MITLPQSASTNMSCQHEARSRIVPGPCNVDFIVLSSKADPLVCLLQLSVLAQTWLPGRDEVTLGQWR